MTIPPCPGTARPPRGARFFVRSILAATLIPVLYPALAHAQYGAGPGMMPGMPRPQPGMTDDQTKEGPAEAAPDEESEAEQDRPLGTLTEALQRRTQLLELDGYFRLRTDWFRQLHLGQTYQMAEGGGELLRPPFPTPLQCGAQPNTPCRTESIGGANTRLRLEPIINITNEVRVLAQIDVLDNVIAGSTPDSFQRVDVIGVGTDAIAHPFLSNSQTVPEPGRTGFTSSIRAKRAWGEIDSNFGTLRFGRMPWHFGRGMSFNAGLCPDCDGGTTVDRLMALTQLYGHTFALAWDFGQQGVSGTQSTIALLNPDAPPIDLTQTDDVFQVMAAIVKKDEDEVFRAKALRGDMAVNYGLQLMYRDQDRTYYPDTSNGQNDATLPPPSEVMQEGAVAPNPIAYTPEALAMFLRPLDALMVVPSLWFKLGWKGLTVEAEGNAVLGRIGQAGPLRVNGGKLNLRQFGWVVASDLALFKNSFFLGFETGGATGDSDEPRGQYLNYNWRRTVQTDGAITDFKFSPEYHVDQILFRRILGTVTNAIYLKPQLAYWLNLAEQRQLGLMGSAIYSMAANAVSTPGNARNYGIEVNLGVTYRNHADKFYAGVVWGILWPLGALDRPRGLWPMQQDAATAQVIRGMIGIQF